MANFRGNWNASVVKPAFNAFSFLPTAPAMKPRVRLEEGVVPSTEHLIEVVEGRVLECAPSDADILCSIQDRDKYVRVGGLLVNLVMLSVNLWVVLIDFVVLCCFLLKQLPRIYFNRWNLL